MYFHSGTPPFFPRYLSWHRTLTEPLFARVFLLMQSQQIVTAFADVEMLFHGFNSPFSQLSSHINQLSTQDNKGVTIKLNQLIVNTCISDFFYLDVIM